MGALFAIVLLDASIIGASAVTLSTSYAFGDVFGIKHSLHRSFRDARQFYAAYTALVVVAAAIVLIPRAPLGLITTSVQALAGVLLPSASVFLLLLCNDPEVLGPWVNKRWLNVLATVIIGVLLTLSGTLVVSTVFPHLNVADVAMVVALALIVAGGGTGLLLELTQRRGQRRPAGPAAAERAGAEELADAAAGPAQAGAVVTRDQAGHAAAPRLSGGLGRPARREGRSARRRVSPRMRSFCWSAAAGALLPCPAAGPGSGRTRPRAGRVPPGPPGPARPR